MKSGTLFLDEIGELPITMQADLLRVLQHGEFKRVGGNTLIKVNVRIVAATNRNLQEAIKTGRFRQDLFFRLDVLTVEMPRLSERREDIPLLAAHFMKNCGQIRTHPFPPVVGFAALPCGFRSFPCRFERERIGFQPPTVGLGSFLCGIESFPGGMKSFPCGNEPFPHRNDLQQLHEESIEWGRHAISPCGTEFFGCRFKAATIRFNFSTIHLAASTIRLVLESDCKDRVQEVVRFPGARDSWSCHQWLVCR